MSEKMFDSSADGVAKRLLHQVTDGRDYRRRSIGSILEAEGQRPDNGTRELRPLGYLETARVCNLTRNQ